MKIETAGMTRILTEGLDNWEITLKYYPAMAKRGYCFATNIDDDLNPRRYKNAKDIDVDAKYYIDGVKYREVKRVIVKGLLTRDLCGAIRHDGYPVFVKLEQFE